MLLQMWSFTNTEVAVRGVVLQVPWNSCRSLVTLTLNEKEDGRNYFYFLLGARKKEGGTLYYVIKKQKQKTGFH